MNSVSSQLSAQEYAQYVIDLEKRHAGRKVLKCVSTQRLEAQIHFEDGSNVTVSGLLAWEINRRLRDERE